MTTPIYLTDNQVAARYGVSKPTVWRWVRTNPNFPAPVKLSTNCSRWTLASLESWESARQGVA